VRRLLATLPAIAIVTASLAPAEARAAPWPGAADLHLFVLDPGPGATDVFRERVKLQGGRVRFAHGTAAEPGVVVAKVDAVAAAKLAAMPGVRLDAGHGKALDAAALHVAFAGALDWVASYWETQVGDPSAPAAGRSRTEAEGPGGRAAPGGARAARERRGPRPPGQARDRPDAGEDRGRGPAARQRRHARPRVLRLVRGRRLVRQDEDGRDGDVVEHGRRGAGRRDRARGQPLVPGRSDRVRAAQLQARVHGAVPVDGRRDGALRAAEDVRAVREQHRDVQRDARRRERRRGRLHHLHRARRGLQLFSGRSTPTTASRGPPGAGRT